jgi:hypothetical protein
MTTEAWLAAPFAAAGDTARFGAARERVEAMLSAQRAMWRDEPGAWTVIPLDRTPAAFAMVARDSEGERRGREVICAFVGPGVARLDATPLTLSTAAPADAVLRSQGISYVVPFIQNLDKDSTELLTALERLVSVRSTQPDIRRDVVPALPFLLRDYWLALQQADSAESARLYARIEQVGRLGAENLRFLRVDRLASLGRWQELAGLPEFRDLSRARRPRRISEELLEALWRTRIASAEGVASAAQAIERFTVSGIVNDYQSLLRSVDVPKSAASRRLVAISACLDAQDDRLGRLFDTADEAERQFITDLMSWRDGGRARTVAVTGPVAPDSIDALVALEDWEAVLQAAEACPSDPRAAEAAVKAAYEAGDPGLSRRAVVLISLIPEGQLNTSRGFRHSLNEVRKSATDDCASWAAWLVRVGQRESWRSAAEVVRAESGGWDIAEFTSDDAAQEAGAALLEASGNTNADQVLRCLDLLCDLARDLVDRMIGAPLVDAVLMVLGEQANPSHQVREAFRGLLEPLLDSGPLPKQYAGYVTLIRDLWGKVQARSTFDWGLDLADLLFSMQCPDQAARQLFVQDLMNWAAANHQPLEFRQTVMANAIAEQAGLGAILELNSATPEDENVWARLAGARIGLYSLLPKVGSHLREQLGKLVHAPVTVEQNTDHVATSALTKLAASADYMVVDTWHAKHPATMAIDSVLPRDRQILPRGGGVMSFLAALQDRLESDGLRVRVTWCPRTSPVVSRAAKCHHVSCA